MLKRGESQGGSKKWRTGAVIRGVVHEDPVNIVAVLMEEGHLLQPAGAHIEAHAASCDKGALVELVALAIHVPAHAQHTALDPASRCLCHGDIL